VLGTEAKKRYVARRWETADAGDHESRRECGPVTGNTVRDLRKNINGAGTLSVNKGCGKKK
jgi:hypothetical protein